MAFKLLNSGLTSIIFGQAKEKYATSEVSDTSNPSLTFYKIPWTIQVFLKKKEPQSRKTGRSGRATGDNKIRFTAEEERRYLIPCGVRGQARLGRGRALCPGGADTHTRRRSRQSQKVRGRGRLLNGDLVRLRCEWTRGARRWMGVWPCARDVHDHWCQVVKLPVLERTGYIVCERTSSGLTRTWCVVLGTDS